MTTPPRTPRTLVFLIREEEKQVLLARKAVRFGAGYWNGYGGKLDENETIEEAARRELREEAGITAGKLTPVATIDYAAEGTADGNYSVTVTVFLCTDWEGIPSATEEMDDPQWFRYDALPTDKMWDSDRIWLPRVLAGERFHATFTYAADGETLRDYRIESHTV